MTHEELNGYESKSQMKRIEILKAGENQMTQKELLAHINEKIESVENISGIKATPWRIIFAVVELHKPTEPLKWRGYRKVGDEWIIGCSCGSDRLKGGTEYPYPCPTIQAIEKELE